MDKDQESRIKESRNQGIKESRGLLRVASCECWLMRAVRVVCLSICLSLYVCVCVRARAGAGAGAGDRARCGVVDGDDFEHVAVKTGRIFFFNFFWESI